MGVQERRERDRERRRSQIVDAARTVFVREGLEGATMDEIAEEAELSKGALYLHFKGKDELYVEVLQRHISKVLEAATERLKSARYGLEAVELFVRNHIEFAHGHHDMFRLAMSWMFSRFHVETDTDGFARYRARIQGMGQLLRSAIERGQGDGSVRRDIPAEQLATQVLGSTLGILVMDSNRDAISQRLPEDFDPSQALSSFVAMITAGIRDPAFVPEEDYAPEEAAL